MNKDVFLPNNDLMIEIAQHAFQNETSIKKSKKCGCYYCMKIFDSNEVVDWINDKRGKTALCPYCDIDSVLGDDVVEITEELLKEMHDSWFQN